MLRLPEACFADDARPIGCAGLRSEKSKMWNKAYSGAVLGCIIFFSLPRAVSRDTHESPLTRQTPTQSGIGRWCKATGPAMQSPRHASGESAGIAGFKERRRNLKEFKAAEQFMQLKAAMIEDLSRSEESRRAQPKRDAIHDANLDSERMRKGSSMEAGGAAEATHAIPVLSVTSKPGGSSQP